MPLNSIHTNVGAIIALQGLNKTNRELDETQKAVNTGFRIADARDDGAGFAIAQGLRSDVKAYEAVNEQLSKARGLLLVASEGATRISDTLSDVRATLTKLADENVTGSQRSQLENEYTALKDEITNFINSAEFSGANLLSATADTTVIANIDGSTQTLTGQDLATNVSDNLTAVTSAADAQALIDGSVPGDFFVAETNIGNALADIGAEIRRIDNQLDYLGIISDATETGIGDIVDADLAKESARLQSLQIRQQLGAQTLNIANAAPQVLLSFFQ